MIVSLETCTIQELQDGYAYSAADRAYRCLLCGQTFPEGEIIPIGGRLYEARYAAAAHRDAAHPDYFAQLLNSDSKYVALTDNQKALFALIHAGRTDKEIAAQLHITPSTVRHHQFAFREKAKQARLFLALYGMATAGAPGRDDILPIHANAKMVDDRYIITEKERDSIFAADFESLEPLRLKVFPVKEKKKLAILTRIAEEFEIGRQYAEKEVNTILAAIYDDYVTIRRYLIEYGFMDRTTDCSAYWRVG